MEGEATSLRQKMVAVLKSRAEQLTYRKLTDALWQDYPEFHAHMLGLNDGVESEARKKLRIRMGMEVKAHPDVFAATKVDDDVVVGLAATEDDAAVELEEEEEEEQAGVTPSVYWYTFPAYKSANGAYPIKIGKGIDPEARIMQQVTPMPEKPEKPEILGQLQHPEADNLEKAVQYILKVRGKRKADAPGAEWFLTTPQEITSLSKPFSVRRSLSLRRASSAVEQHRFTESRWGVRCHRRDLCPNWRPGLLRTDGVKSVSAHGRELQRSQGSDFRSRHDRTSRSTPSPVQSANHRRSFYATKR